MAASGARGRRAAVLRRRQPQRHPRRGAAGRHGLRHRAHEPAQDLRGAARRRRARCRTGRRVGAARARTCPDPLPVRRRRRPVRVDDPRQVDRARFTPGTATRWRWCGRTPTSCSTAANGLRRVAEAAVLNANWLRHRLRGTYDIPYDRPNMHEFVASTTSLKKAHGLKAIDVAKRLLEEGFHAPTVYFPLIVDEALMIEPTETESPQTVAALADALDPHRQRSRRRQGCAPHHTGEPRRRSPRRPPAHPDLRRPPPLTLLGNFEGAIGRQRCQERYGLAALAAFSLWCS